MICFDYEPVFRENRGLCRIFLTIRAQGPPFSQGTKMFLPGFCPVIPVLWFPSAGQIRPDLEEGGILVNSSLLRGVMVTGQYGSYEGMGLAE
jgi:hypothetical protein